MRSAKGQSENRAQSAGAASVAHFEKRLVMYRNPRVALGLTYGLCLASRPRVVDYMWTVYGGPYKVESRSVLSPQLEVTTGRMHTR